MVCVCVCVHQAFQETIDIFQLKNESFKMAAKEVEEVSVSQKLSCCLTGLPCIRRAVVEFVNVNENATY